MSTSRPIVLLLTHSEDHFVIDLVADRLMQRGADAVRVNLDQYPNAIPVSSAFDAIAESNRIGIDGRFIDASAVRAVWTRHLWPPTMDRRLDPQYRNGCVTNAITARDGFLASMHGARWINRLQPLRLGFNKLHQLRAARQLGLSIPRTLVTNSAEDARRFFDMLEGRVVAKVLVNLSASMGQASFFVRTTQVTQKHIDALDQLRHSPIIFQERLTKVRELRVAYVSGQVFTGAIKAADLADWRLASAVNTRWERAELSDETARLIRELMRSLELEYGAIDLIETPEGRAVFLEVNPTGEWGMLQKCLDLPIADAIADALWAKEQHP